MDQALTLNKPIHFLKIDVEGFELNALDSATRLFESGLVEHAVLEFGPPDRWDVTVSDHEPLNMTEIRKRTIARAKRVLRLVTTEWDMDIYLLPASGWASTVQYMHHRNITFSNMPTDNQVVHKLKAWDFDQQPFEQDEFERELESMEQLVTQVIPLPDYLIDDYMDSLETIGEMYLWFAKRSGHPAVTAKLEI
ncbi:hypothetical protein K492DRAFT_131388 [Lichtheimia hyalospora FSU 10163]|nr:hypothetical protein K492DRAFT_131388 [Lichtheimia hyalospora FSU 10163]